MLQPQPAPRFSRTEPTLTTGPSTPGGGTRAVLEGDPHAVLEGMAIGAYAIGASEGYVYVRAEYPLAVKRLRKASAAERSPSAMRWDRRSRCPGRPGCPASPRGPR